MWGGTLEAARALLDVIALIGDASGKKIEMPAWATSLEENIDVKDLGTELLSCELHKNESINNFMKAIFCPLKYGTQGMDALRAVHRIGGEKETSSPLDFVNTPPDVKVSTKSPVY